MRFRRFIALLLGMAILPLPTVHAAEPRVPCVTFYAEATLSEPLVLSPHHTLTVHLRAGLTAGIMGMLALMFPAAHHLRAQEHVTPPRLPDTVNAHELSEPLHGAMLDSAVGRLKTLINTYHDAIKQARASDPPSPGQINIWSNVKAPGDTRIKAVGDQITRLIAMLLRSIPLNDLKKRTKLPSELLPPKEKHPASPKKDAAHHVLGPTA